MLEGFRGLKCDRAVQARRSTRRMEERPLQVTAGYGSLAAERFNIYGMIDYQKFGALAAREREFSKSYYIPGAFNQHEFGLVSRECGRPQQRLPQSDGRPANGYQNPSCARRCLFPLRPAAPNPAPNRCNFDPAYFLNSINASERLAATGEFTWQFSPDHKFFVRDLSPADSFTSWPRRLRSRASSCPATSPWYPHASRRSLRDWTEGHLTHVAVGGDRGPDQRARARAMECGRRPQGTLARMALTDSAFSNGVNSVDDRYTSRI